MFYQIARCAEFYLKAVTKYQLHSPFAFDLANAVLEDKRFFYAFRDVEAIRNQMLGSDEMLEGNDFGAGEGQVVRKSLRSVVQRAASRPRQGKMLFRLVEYFHPDKLLELGASVGMSTMYIAAASGNAEFMALEGNAAATGIASANLDRLGLKKAAVVTGPFESTLKPALEKLKTIDWVFFDGNHRPEPTLSYFETCLSHAHDQTVFVFDDVYWSAGMAKVWRQVQAHPRVTGTVDFFDLSLAFLRPEIKVKQHWRIVPASWKPWKI